MQCLIYKISTLNKPSLINLLGTNLDFNYSDWISFSNIHNLSLSEINPNNYNIRWFHRRLPDAIKAANKTVSYRDLEFWSVIREELPESSTLDNALLTITEDETITEEDIEPVILNPLTDEPPEAVINN